jgi:acyl-CoA dehydrogenase
VSGGDEVRELVRDLLSGDVAVKGWQAAWDRLAEAGLPLVGLPEEQGGSGGTLQDLAAVVEEVAAAGIATPLVENHVARWLLGAEVADDASILTAAHDDAIHVVAGTISGILPTVEWVDAATRLVLAGRRLSGCVWVRTSDLRVEELPGQVRDAGHPAVVTLEAAAAEDGPPGPSSDRVLARFGLLRAAALTGAARATYSLTKDYVSTREQFGAPLVHLQPVAAGIAAMSVAVLQARTALEIALERPTDLAAATVARIVAGRSASAVASTGHQLHGAMGVTQEYPLHRLTSLIWSGRDADLPERAWLRRAGEDVMAGGEEALWHFGTD